MSWGRACVLEDQLSEEVAELLEKAAVADNDEEDDRQLPDELERRQERLAQIRQAKAMMGLICVTIPCPPKCGAVSK